LKDSQPSTREEGNIDLKVPSNPVDQWQAGLEVFPCPFHLKTQELFDRRVGPIVGKLDLITPQRTISSDGT